MKSVIEKIKIQKEELEKEAKTFYVNKKLYDSFINKCESLNIKKNDAFAALLEIFLEVK